MSEDGRTQVEQVFLTASDLDDADRAAYLESACADSEALHRRAQARLILDDAQAAERDLRQAVVSLASGYGDEHPETVAARERLQRLTY